MYDYRSIELPANLRDTFAGKPPYQPDRMWPFHDTGHMSDDDWRRSHAFYRGFVTMLDRALGEVLAALKRSGLRDNTLVIFLADHGDMNGAHNRFDKGPYCYDEILWIPLLIRAPGVRHREVSRHVSSIDLNRTLTEWMGLEPDRPNLDSRSLFPLMERGDEGWDGPDQAFYRYEWYNGLWFGIRCVRTPQFKYSFNPAGPDELYDLAKDPGELRNLAETPEHTAVQRDLQARLLEHLRSTADSMLYSKLKSCLGA
jgi:arylsulfatase A-like enzyme